MNMTGEIKVQDKKLNTANNGKTLMRNITTKCGKEGRGENVKKDFEERGRWGQEKEDLIIIRKDWKENIILYRKEDELHKYIVNIVKGRKQPCEHY